MMLDAALGGGYLQERPNGLENPRSRPWGERLKRSDYGLERLELLGRILMRAIRRGIFYGIVIVFHTAKYTIRSDQCNRQNW